jgi:predicted dithiol-disulfide oxidoreductase (DUF899 family)
MTDLGMHWPNESEPYRRAREALLRAEIELRAQEEAIAAQRRALPDGGLVIEEYTFDSPSGSKTLVDLFTSDKDTLYLYNFMYIPGASGTPLEAACPNCTSIIDAMDGAFRHLRVHMDIAVVAKAPIDQFAAWGDERGWRFTPLYSSSRTTFNRDYNAETDDGHQLPLAHVFKRVDGRIHHQWSSELLAVPSESGEETRHVDYMWPIWKVLDVTGIPRGDWHPHYAYGD